MRAAALGLILPLCLGAQPSESGRAALISDLRSLRATSAAPEFPRQLGAHILMVAEKTHEPSAPVLRRFCQDFTAALRGRAVSQPDLDGIAADILQTLWSAGVSTITYQDALKDFEARLLHIAVPAARARTVADDLQQIGKEARGPDDVPVMKEPLLPRK